MKSTPIPGDAAVDAGRVNEGREQSSGDGCRLFLCDARCLQLRLHLVLRDMVSIERQGVSHGGGFGKSIYDGQGTSLLRRMSFFGACVMM